MNDVALGGGGKHGAVVTQNVGCKLKGGLPRPGWAKDDGRLSKIVGYVVLAVFTGVVGVDVGAYHECVVTVSSSTADLVGAHHLGSAGEAPTLLFTDDSGLPLLEKYYDHDCNRCRERGD